MYKIVRCFQDENIPARTIKSGLTLEEAQDHCSDPETSWKTATSYQARKRTEKYGPWFDAYDEE